MRLIAAEYADVEDALRSARQLKEHGCSIVDCLTPYNVPELAAFVPAPRTSLRWPMASAGFAAALIVFWFEWWTTARLYPFNSGGRPLFSWQVFLLVPFEVGIFAAGFAGVVAFFFGCGLPRLHHPVFDLPIAARATQDRFVLVLDRDAAHADRQVSDLLQRSGALSITETPP
jgi:hypothetical protein